jgi:hypothetical protein
VSIDAQIAQIGGVGQIVDGQFCKSLVFKFGHLDTVLARWKIVFLLASHFAGVTTRAVVVIYEKSILGHPYSSLNKILPSPGFYVTQFRRSYRNRQKYVTIPCINNHHL